MPLRVRIHEDMARMNLHVTIFVHNDRQERRALTFEDGMPVWIDWAHGTEGPSAYTFSAEHAALIYQAMREHYNEPGDPQLRRDYNSERERVDRLIGMFGMSHDKLQDLAFELVPQPLQTIESVHELGRDL